MRDERLYLADILEAAEAIGRFVAGMTEEDWIEDPEPGNPDQRHRSQ
jgi:uncharacterized protein with HEPN domain